MGTRVVGRSGRVQWPAWWRSGGWRPLSGAAGHALCANLRTAAHAVTAAIKLRRRSPSPRRPAHQPPPSASSPLSHLPLPLPLPSPSPISLSLSLSPLSHLPLPLSSPSDQVFRFLTSTLWSTFPFYSFTPLARAGPLLGAERAGPGGCLNTPRLTQLMGHVATRGKRHSKERQKS